MTRTITTSEAQIVRSAWRRGRLAYKLRDHQHILYEAIWNAIITRRRLKYFVNCARRFGKTHVLCLIAVEYAIRYPNSMIRFAAPTAGSLRKSIFPIMKIIFNDCPTSMTPNFKGVDGMYEFSNGSQIHMSGTDNGHHETLRGTRSDLNIIDEGGFMDNLSYIVKSILIPQTLTCNGFTLISSTPPKVADHDCYYLYKECAEKGDVSEFTIDDNSSITAEQKALYAEESGGYDSTTYKREYLAQYVTDSENAIIPEWSDDYIMETARDQYYEYYHKYVALDTGVRDFTAALFGYYDFSNSRLVIEDEYTINGPEMTTDDLAEAIKDKERELWSTEPKLRIADNNNLVLIQDLSKLHKLRFVATNKTSLESMVNRVRILVKEGRLVINPRCKMLIGNLQYATWAKQSGEAKMMFGRSKTYGHFDHLAALVYLIRNIDYNTNPIPRLLSITSEDHFIGRDVYRSRIPDDASSMARAFQRHK